MTTRVLTFLLFILPCSQITLACTCGSLGPQPCAGLSPANIVFVGTVLNITNPPPDDAGLGAAGTSQYHFRIDENFVGAESKEIDVYSGRGGADCSYHFKQGRQYLVFPYRGEDSRLIATICSDTRPIEYAQAILPQLRAMRDRQRVASVYGILRSSQQPYASVSDDELGRILPGARLELRSEGKTLAALTDSNGAYAFYDVPEGKYNFAGELPEHFEFAEEILGGLLSSLTLPAHACLEANLTALPTGRIRGRVLGPDGKPLAFATVDLFRREKYSEELTGVWFEAQDRKTAHFEFQNVGPGDYLLISNHCGCMDADEPYPRTFYPGVLDLKAAKVIHLEAGQKLDDIDIKVSGGLPTREITIRLVANRGELPNINYVEGKGSNGQSTTEEEVSPGVYLISILKGVQYDFHGEGLCTATNKNFTTKSVRVDGSDEKATVFKLKFRGPGCPRNPSNGSK